MPAGQNVWIDRLEVFEDREEADFLRLAEDCASRVPSVVLLSGGKLLAGGENRYSVACWDPLVTLSAKGDKCLVVADRRAFELICDPLEVLDRLCAGFTLAFGLEVPPFSGGAMGYFAYDLKNAIERLPNHARDDLGLPDLFLFWPRHVLVYDRQDKKLSNLVLRLEGEDPADGRPLELGNPSGQVASLECGPLHCNFTHEEYLAAVAKVRDYIHRGDVYQVNLSQRFHCALEGDSFRLWKSLFDRNPAPFYAYINAGDHRILSTSMERFLFRRDRFIETRPIKGTRKRGQTGEEDEALAAELLRCPKDDAELSMIVDLLRNDLGRICTPGSIRVAEHKRLESYGNVHHLISIVTGELRSEITPGGIIRSTFPGGSITGCPKIRSMEIIDELKSNARHIYTGAIGYLGWHQNLDLNVAIRTAIVKDQTCYFSVGGGIVYDSVEEDEYQETLHKGRSLFEVIGKPGAYS